MRFTNSELKLIELDSKLVQIAKEIKILTALDWPSQTQATFLKNWKEGKASLPKIDYPKIKMSKELEAIREIRKAVDRGHPVGQFIYNTATSYLRVSKLIEAIGTPEVTQYAIKLYGRPGNVLTGSHTHNVEAAQHFIDIAINYAREYRTLENTQTISAATLKQHMQDEMQKVFGEHSVEVKIEPHLTAKAMAGASRVRLREGICYTPYEVSQLLEHEVFVHTLTAINGREQPNIKSLGLAAPRTTGIQEGLATFAELVTGAIDINRMERISLRIVAIEKALQGADFIDIFKYFLESGQC